MISPSSMHVHVHKPPANKGQLKCKYKGKRSRTKTASKPQHFVSPGLSGKEEKNTLQRDLKTEFILLDAQATSADFNINSP